MGKVRPTDECKLCRKLKMLCDSHYLPKSSYGLTKAPGLKNPHPVMSVNGQLKQISDQYRGYVLCEECEGRFSSGGEAWLMPNLPKGENGNCPLQDALLPLTPSFFGHRLNRYNVSGVSAFDIPKLVYFGMSVFWRGSAHEWKTSTGQKAPTVDLGVYQEPMRQFLLGKEFPNNVILALDIWPYKPSLPLLYPVITEPLSSDVCRYWFYLPGLQFFLFTGNNLPKDVCDSSLSEGTITVDGEQADIFKKFVSDLLKAQKQGPNIDAMFKEIVALRSSKTKGSV
jgi:hypothetical protein